VVAVRNIGPADGRAAEACARGAIMVDLRRAVGGALQAGGVLAAARFASMASIRWRRLVIRATRAAAASARPAVSPRGGGLVALKTL
jgi:hypothetical protein